MVSTGIYLKKQKKAPSELQSIESLKGKVEADLAQGAGTTRIKSRDPIFHITESFRATFDLFGQNNAGQGSMTGDFTGRRGEIYSNEREKEESGVTGQNGMAEKRHGEPNPRLGTEFPYYVSTEGEKTKGDFYRRFSEIAFHNGCLASAILQNGGKTMFVSCLKRALGQSEPTNFLQSKLFSASSVKAPLRNSSAKAVFNRYTNSAIGLVVESIQSARKTLENFERLAAEDSEEAVPGMKGDTLRTLYPFLHMDKDRERLAEYEEKLRELTLREENAGDRKERNEIAAQKAVLTGGITKIQGLIARKRQLQERFFCRLEELLEKSRKAEAIFTAPGFAAQVVEEIMDFMDSPESSGDNGEDDNGDKPEQPSGLA